MTMYLNRKVGNDVNGAPHQRMRSVASGRSGIDGATQVVNKRNPCATEQIFGCKEQTYVGTWNVRTLYATGQLEILIHQMKDVNWSILGLSEVRWTGEGEINKEDYKIIYSGRTDDRHQDGVALIMKKEAARALLGYKAVSPRIIKARFRTAFGRATVVQVYAPTADSTEEDVESFYADLQGAIQNIPDRDLAIVMGDFNAKVGREWREWEGVIGKFGYGEENERGERLLNFCLNNRLKVMNTAFYQRKGNRKWTWESPDGRTKNMIDFILVGNRWKNGVTTCRTFSKPDVNSDHKLVMAGFKIRLRTVNKNTIKRRFDTEKLKETEIRQKYSNMLNDRWKQTRADELQTVESTWKKIRAIYTETAEGAIGYKKNQPRKPWISKEVLEMSEKRRDMRPTRAKSEENKKRYNKITKDIKRRVKECKENWMEEKCRELEKNAKTQQTDKLFRAVKEICGTFRTRTTAVRDEEGHILEDTEKIKERWKQYYKICTMSKTQWIRRY